ncbi:Alcohol dehydrogenase acceptor [Porphyridium purpureum]|uniref:Alcohol dehydrogenase acceptor n=1 Tax=Porphyridium purpureum TaxID=35688 RepID=A0A5J4YRZ3_PORPP|nr:Alcohol dehydrogenase acceptor [Porphyridium purpureum]|eukprot:POR2548..scf229_5
MDQSTTKAMDVVPPAMIMFVPIANGSGGAGALRHSRGKVGHSACLAATSGRRHRPSSGSHSARRLDVRMAAALEQGTHRSLTGEVDYVIVGGGAAGCVLANRLSADKNVSVLLLEAGGKGDSFKISVPLGFPYLCGSDIDWKYLSEPEEELHERRVYFPRGKMLGGSHSMSVMLYHRGEAADYEQWEAMGAEGWGPDGVLPFFKKSEHQHAKDMDSAFHSKSGPLSVSDLRRVNPLTKVFLEACEGAGMPRNEDFNNWNSRQDGMGTFQVTQREGMRESPATAYLRPVVGRRNLRVETHASVEKVLIDEGSKTAVGVSYVNKDGRKVKIQARKEVILAAGSLATPQLLMLSGIGDRHMLDEFGIPVIQHLPGVGQNLQDQPAVMLSYQSPNPYVDKNKTQTYYTERTGKDIRSILSYLFLGNGPLTSPMCEAGGFVRSDPSQRSCDLQLRFIPFVSEPDPYHSLGDFATGGEYLTNKSNRPAGFTLQSVVTRPKSRGYVALRSADFRDRPMVVPRWLEDKADLKTMVEGIKLCRKIASQSQFAQFRGDELYPGPQLSSDADLESYIRESCHTANAVVGSCRMGALDDDSAVVDPSLRVKHIKNLRVIDSSVMPTLPGGQAGAPTMMIAEKGAELVFILALSESAHLPLDAVGKMLVICS